MKLLKSFCFAFIVLFLFSATNGFSQKQCKSSTFTIFLVDDSGQEHTFMVSGLRFETPSGNFLGTFRVKVPKETMKNFDFSPFANDIKEVAINIDSSEETLIANGYLNKAGNLHIELHKNGSGTIFPKGWFE